LNAFEEAIHPQKMLGITVAVLNRFRAAEAKLVAPATVNKHLRHLRAALQAADDLGYLKEVPKIKKLSEPVREVIYMPHDVATAIYAACDVATRPAGQAYAPADWWRALLVFAYQHGWRIGEILALRRDGVDLDRGTAFIAGESTKARKDTTVLLHPEEIEHFRRLAGFTDHLFPWPHGLNQLYDAFYAIQAEAKTTRRWGFHSLRRACGTMNAGTLQPGDLQSLMRHSALATTMKFYVNPLANQQRAVASLFVPQWKAAGGS
jgi:integrase